MYASIGTLLTFALGIAVNPASIVAAILLLTSNQGATKGLAYLVGWLFGLMTLIFGTLLIILIRGNTSAELAAWGITIAGLILLIMAYVQWRQRPPPGAEIIPFDWLRAIPRATSFMALSAGLFFGLFSAKNVLITAAAVMIIRDARLEPLNSLMIVVLFVALATSGVAAPVYVAITQNSRANAILTDWEYRLSIHNVTITCIVLVIIAIQLIGIGLGKLL